MSSLPWLSRISDTSENQPKRLDDQDETWLVITINDTVIGNLSKLVWFITTENLATAKLRGYSTWRANPIPKDPYVGGGDSTSREGSQGNPQRVVIKQIINI